MRYEATAMIVVAALMLGSANGAERIAEATRCAAVARSFDDGDVPAARAVFDVVMRVMTALDEGYRARGKAMILPEWDRSARSDNTALVVMDCRMNPDWSLGRAAADVYEGFRGNAR